MVEEPGQSKAFGTRRVQHEDGTQAEGAHGASQVETTTSRKGAHNEMLLVISDQSKQSLLGKAAVSAEPESVECANCIGCECGSESGSGCGSELETGIGLKLDSEPDFQPSQSISGCSNWIQSSANPSSTSSDTNASTDNEHPENNEITANEYANLIVCEEYNKFANENNYNEHLKQQVYTAEEELHSEKDTYNCNESKDGIIAVKEESINGCEYDAHSLNRDEIINDSNKARVKMLATDHSTDSVSSHKGNAIVYYVSKSIAYAHNCLSEVITCPVLTWSGGNNDNLDAEGLDEVISVGDLVYVEACRTGNGNLRAQNWSFTEDSAKKQAEERTKDLTDVDERSGSALCDSFTQTAITAEQMILRAITPEMSDYLQRRIPNILAFTSSSS